MSPQEELRAGIEALGLQVAAEQQQSLLRYLIILEKWNKVYNLTAIRNRQDMVSHHLLDSLAVLPYLWGGRWLDVGCGAGLPGMVLAIVCPNWSFTLLDSNSKKTGFVQQAVIELGLMNVTVACARVEDYECRAPFDGIISRAFTELGGFITVTNRLKSKNGKWVAMKGLAEKELESVPPEFKIEQVVPLRVPGLDAARSLVVVSSNGAK